MIQIFYFISKTIVFSEIFHNELIKNYLRNQKFHEIVLNREFKALFDKCLHAVTRTEGRAFYTSGEKGVTS